MSDVATRVDAPSLHDMEERAARNPFSNDAPLAVVTALAGVEQQRGIAEVQARMIMARSNPRNPMHSMDMILQDCTRESLAKEAQYHYARGGGSVDGPSIRLAEAMARRWGNIASGIKELSRADGYSECVAYAWDLETGYYDERQYQVRHWRDTKGGGYKLTDERDIYELVANMGQRRKRAVLLTVIPSDVTEAALAQCDETLRTHVDKSPDAMKKLEDAFAAFGVTRTQLERRCQCRFDAIRPAQIVQLRKVYMSMKDGMSDARDWFDAPSSAWTEIAERHQADAAPARSAPQPAQRAARQTRRATPDTVPAVTQAPAAPIVPDDGPAATPSPEAVPELPPTSGDAAPGFDYWLFDEFGETTGDEPYINPVQFARELEALWQSSFDKERLLNQNSEAIAAAESDQRAAAIIDSMREPSAPEPIVIVLKVERGKPNVGQYLRDFKTTVPTLTTETYMPFVAANYPTLVTVPISTRGLCLKELATRAEALGLKPPAILADAMKGSKEEQEAEYQKDANAVKERIKELEAIKTEPELYAWNKGPILQSFGGRLQAEGKEELFGQLHAAYTRRLAELKAPSSA